MPKKQTKKEFIEKSKKIFGGELDYSKVDYIDSRTDVVLTCKKHGDFLRKPAQHLSYKRGCYVCSGIRLNTISFIERAKHIHGNLFLYEKVIFKNIKLPVIITCKIHGDFYQVPDKHINAKQGCPKCSIYYRKDIKYVIKMGNKIHNYKYDYSLVNFSKMNTKIIIVCPKHGKFEQTPTNHITYEHGCPICSVRVSKKETKWLNSLNIDNDKLHRSVHLYCKERYFIVDGFDPKTNIVYEFYGDFWHGNPKKYKRSDINSFSGKTFGRLFSDVMKRQNILIKNGYKVIYIWENDWDKLQTDMDRHRK